MEIQPIEFGQQFAVQRTALALMRKALLAQRDKRAFVETVGRDDHGDALRLEPLHQQWFRHVDYCWERRLRCMILAHYGSGKCQPANARVQMADGSLVELGSLNGLVTAVLAFDEETGQYRPCWGRCFPNGVKRVWRVTLVSGRATDVTEEHPFWTIDGWKRAADLVQGEFVATAQTLPPMGHHRLRDGEAELLGYLVGDGSCGSGCPAFTNAEPEILEDFQRAASLLEFKTPEQRYTGYSSRARTLRLTIGTFAEREPRHRSPMAWLRLHGLAGHKSQTKRVPPAIFMAPQDQIARYLGAYFACDGHVPDKGGTVEYYSVSRELLQDTQALLTRFGVVTRLRIKRGQYLGEVHISWRLSIAAVSLRAFTEQIRVVGKKAELLRRATERRNKNALIGNGDLVPLGYRHYLLRSAHWHRQNTHVALDQCAVDGYRQKASSRAVVRAAAIAEANPKLLLATDPSVWWDEIVSIVDVGEQTTFGMEVDGLNTYVTDGIIVHNTSSLIVPLITWLVGRDPNVRIKVVTNDDAGAAKRVNAAKRIIESDEYRRVWPNVRQGDRWTDHEIYVRRLGSSPEPTVHARGIFTTGIGGRCDALLLDDVVDQKNSTDPAQRKRVLDLCEQTWFSRLEPDGKILYVATSWHQQDASHVLMQQKGWCTLVQRVSQDCLQIEQEVLGAYDGQYPTMG